MKKQRSKMNRLYPVIFLAGLTFTTVTCELDKDLLTEKDAQTDDLGLSKSQYKSGSEILNLSYVIETRTRFITDNEKFTDLDIACMVPKSEKQKICMKLFEDGQIEMEIDELDLTDKIKIPHKTIEGDEKKPKKQVYRSNTFSTYADNGSILNTFSLATPNQLETVKKIKELGKNLKPIEINKLINKMQGQQIIENLDLYIENTCRNGGAVIQHDDNFLTIRMPLKNLEAGIKEEVVLLIDKKKNRTVGSRIYNEKGEILMSILYGYGPPEKPFLTAIKEETKQDLPSGKVVTMETYSKIDNIKFKLNL
jgi:hypothetical protein